MSQQRNRPAGRAELSALTIASIALAGLFAACAAQDGIGSVPASTAESTVVRPESTVVRPESTVVRPESAAAKPSKPAPRTTSSTPVRIVKKAVVESRLIPFKKVSVEDSSLAAGEKVVTTRGAKGTKRLTYEVTLTNGVQTAKRLLREVVVRESVDQLTAVGTKVESRPDDQCDPNYSGGCVPIDVDVDCSGGSGNGPAYVRGPVRVTGDDIYGLDRDSDGIGCED